MPNQPLDEREFELVNIIGAKLGSNQRDLSLQMKMSLGQTNMLIRRLIAKGYIRITQLNKKKVKYLLTPKGFSEKVRKSVKYTLNTINSIGLIKNKVEVLIKDLYAKGERNFLAFGEADLLLLIDMVFKSLLLEDATFKHVDKFPEEKMTGVFFVCKEGILNEPSFADHQINLIEELAKDAVFINGDNLRKA